MTIKIISQNVLDKLKICRQQQNYWLKRTKFEAWEITITKVWRHKTTFSVFKLISLQKNATTIWCIEKLSACKDSKCSSTDILNESKMHQVKAAKTFAQTTLPIGRKILKLFIQSIFFTMFNFLFMLDLS
jgi:hypothetical protein